MFLIRQEYFIFGRATTSHHIEEQLSLLYIGFTISILIGYKHAANSCWLCFRYVIPTDNSFYTCRSDVIPTDNSFMHAEVTSPNTLNSSLSNLVMAESTSRFATLSAENLEFLDDKDVNWTFFINI